MGRSVPRRRKGETRDAVTRRFRKAIIGRALGAELSHHLRYRQGESKPDAGTNHRHGTSGKTVLTDGYTSTRARRVPRTYIRTILLGWRFPTN